MSELKHILIKNKTNNEIYEKSTNLLKIKFPIITRWGTFIDCVVFLYENYSKINSFIENLPLHYESLKELSSNKLLISELKLISKHVFIPHAIEKLESNGLEFKEQLDVYLNVKHRIEELLLLTRFSEIETKNPDLAYFYDIYPKNNESELKVFKYVNLTTVCVEQLFSYLTCFSQVKDNQFYHQVYLPIWLKKSINKFLEKLLITS